MRDETWIITGASGALGQALVNALITNEDCYSRPNIYCVVRESSILTGDIAQVVSQVPVKSLDSNNNINYAIELLRISLRNEDRSLLYLVCAHGASINDEELAHHVNYESVRKLCRFAIDHSSQYETELSIGLIGSSSAYLGKATPYARSKRKLAALMGMLHSTTPARINLFVPGAFESKMISDWKPEKRAEVASKFKSGLIASAESIASVVLPVMRSSMATGGVINLTGGQLESIDSFVRS